VDVIVINRDSLLVRDRLDDPVPGLSAPPATITVPGTSGLFELRNADRDVLLDRGRIVGG